MAILLEKAASNCRRVSPRMVRTRSASQGRPNAKPLEAPSPDSSRCLPGFAQLHDLLHPLATGPAYCRLISRWQAFCGISSEGKPTNPVVHLYFQLASALGSEAFFLFPALVWLAYPVATPLVT